MSSPGGQCLAPDKLISVGVKLIVGLELTSITSLKSRGFLASSIAIRILAHSQPKRAAFYLVNHPSDTTNPRKVLKHVRVSSAGKAHNLIPDSPPPRQPL
jgi:hypothetical protein